MPICDVQVRPQVMQLEMFTVGFDALACTHIVTKVITIGTDNAVRRHG